jgi:hypothetical protein
VTETTSAPQENMSSAQVNSDPQSEEPAPSKGKKFSIFGDKKNKKDK